MMLEKVLMQFAERLGNMHAAAIGEKQENEYIKICSSLGIEVRNNTYQFNDRLRQMLLSAGEHTDLTVEDEFYTEMKTITNKLFMPGPFWAYSHGDPCLDNWLFANDRLNLIDFEFGCYRHAFLDGVYGRALFPTCWCTGSIPGHIVKQMENKYRKALIKGCPEASDDTLFYQALTEACCFWAWDNLLGRLSLCLEPNSMYKENIPEWRSQIYSRLNAFITISEESDYLHHVRNTSYKLLEVLENLWPEVEGLDYFPAFRR